MWCYMALAADSINPSYEFMEVMKSNDPNVLAYVAMVEKYQSVDIFGQKTKPDKTNFDVVMAEIYNFIFHLPTERKKQVLDYLGYCYIDKYMTLSLSISLTTITHGNTTTIMPSKSSITSSHAFIMANYDTVEATFFSQFLSFGNMSNFIYFTTTTIGNTSSLVEMTGSSDQIAWVSTSFLGTGTIDVTDQVPTVGIINIGDAFH
ncbi:unnamed protein product [Ambrosiozyma monospora]|uniref:Unnamed protein product n=1 Tax=Ambrosiozyma monospora TaxID=43982 RepID=A0ACB5SWC3_AMBMO|nr:unnamed protein product [Ambrosiozyma monospora]